ncbi:MAG: hypothetical protein JHC26_11835 [Thermofilum sp.]|jgi:hypothetical protein|uniref:hypothetical protein n=1 Tax=Thermofilum sp. TaxID=1961369 RepID=UPI00258F6E40|nr:hypothetical protein [Thermofilum sp.]MCI4409774.1 hypothetical protein [Thermofilum sp.]
MEEVKIGEKRIEELSDQDLFGIIRSMTDVLQDECFYPLDLVILGLAMLELEKRGYQVEFRTVVGIVKCRSKQNGGGGE